MNPLIQGCISPSSSSLTSLEKSVKDSNEEKILHKNRVLCLHCMRTSNNGIRCLGKCISDSDY